jgi:hypothetical protein
MKCLTENQIEEWLDQRTIQKDPYRGKASPAFYLQFYAPTSHRRIDALVRHYYNRIVPEGDSLIHMTDWGHYEQSEMIAIQGIRSSRGEDRMLIDAPGHVLPSAQKEIGISLFSLSASFAWSSYFYSAQDHSTLHNWEGEIFDFWTDSKQAVSEMRLMLNHFDLAETTKGEQAGTRQPATRPVVEPEGGVNHQPEAEGRSR